MSNRILAWFSCGITSAVACKLAIDMYGDAVELWYFEIATAHADNERFIADCERWLGRKINRTRSKKYKDQFEVARAKRYINGPSGAPCTTELKKKPRQEIEKGGFAAQVFGFEFTEKEVNRAVRFEEQYSYTNPIFPLIDRRLSKNNCAAILLKQGIALPARYLQGYSNNNCILCWKGGMGYMNKERVNNPNHFQEASQIEREIGASCINGVFLDELDPTAGRDSEIVMPDCGTFCEIEFADLISDKTKKVMNGSLKIGRQLSFGFEEALVVKQKKKGKN